MIYSGIQWVKLANRSRNTRTGLLTAEQRAALGDAAPAPAPPLDREKTALDAFDANLAARSLAAGELVARYSTSALPQPTDATVLVAHGYGGELPQYMDLAAE